jgi:hypothetical protein
MIKKILISSEIFIHKIHIIMNMNEMTFDVYTNPNNNMTFYTFEVKGLFKFTTACIYSDDSTSKDLSRFITEKDGGYICIYGNFDLSIDHEYPDKCKFSVSNYNSNDDIMSVYFDWNVCEKTLNQLLQEVINVESNEN